MRKPSKKKKHNLRKTPYWIFLFFLGLFLAGIASGEPGRVLEQAISICLSCIGIG